MRLSSILTAATCLAFTSAAAIDSTNANTKKDESSSTEDQGLAKKWLEPEKGENRHFPEPKYFSKFNLHSYTCSFLCFFWGRGQQYEIRASFWGNTNELVQSA